VTRGGSAQRLDVEDRATLERATARRRALRKRDLVSKQTQPIDGRRVAYAGSVHDDAEVDAVLEVLRGGPSALRIGPKVRAFEQRIAQLFGKRFGVMCNSGSSALYLAVELLNLEPGDEIITSAVVFSTDVAPIVRAGLVPVFVDVEPDTYNADAALIEEAVGPRTRAILLPDLIGNAPDWDRVREIADKHRLQVIDDSCDSLGATLRGRPTAARADIGVTSFALSHIITAMGTGGMVVLDDDELRDRCLLLRRWGRRSEPQLYGSLKGQRSRFFSEIDGLEYDNLFIFDEVGWNFEPSEVSAAFGLAQLDKLPRFLERRKRNFALLTERLGERDDVFVLPRTLDGFDNAWHMFPVIIRPESGISRGAFQQHMEQHGVDTRMVWTGNVVRQPAFKRVEHRVAGDGLPNADRVMEHGVVMPCHHGIDDDDAQYIADTALAFLDTPEARTASM
jgi:CDP-6-deoxy-D-xylo-4-hexulose-3-dehydrase